MAEEQVLHFLAAPPLLSFHKPCVFTDYDPVWLQLMAEEQGLQVDLEEFNNYMNQQRERSRVSNPTFSTSSGIYVRAGITCHATLHDQKLIVKHASGFW